MRRRRIGWITGALTAAALAPACAQQAGKAPAAPPAPVVQQTANLAEQIAVLRGIHPLRLSADQIQALLDVIKPGMEKLQQQEQANAKQLAALIPQLQQAATQVAATPARSSPAELEYHRLQLVDQQTSENTRAQLRTALRPLLEKLFTPEQRAALLAEGKSYYLQQRMASPQGGNRGSLDAMARTLDQLRQASAASYPAQRQAFAMRTAEVPNWGQFGPRGGPGAAGPAGGGPGAGGPGGGGPGFGFRAPRMPPGGGMPQPTPEQLQQLNDPAVQARIRQYEAMADQIRGMPEDTYQKQRGALALQFWQAQEERRLEARPDDAIDAFIDGVLLTPVSVEVLEARLKQAPAGSS